MDRVPGIKAVTFDLDGTLWDYEKVMRSSLASALAELGRRDPTAASRLDVERMIDICDKVTQEMASATVDLGLVRLEAFKRTLVDVDRPDHALAEHINEVYFRHRFANVEFYGDVLPVLEALRRRYHIGALSNGNSYPERVGLGHAFHFAVMAQDHGVAKPDRRIFDIAAREAGCSPGQMLHVGDSPTDDVQGAVDAGVHAVWINRIGAERPTSIDGVAEIANLNQLFAILED